MTSSDAELPPVAESSQFTVPDDIAKKIKHAWIAGCISGGITLAFTLLAISGTSILFSSAWELVDVALIFGLAFGISRKSRTCAILMLVYFISAKIFIMSETGKPSGILLAIVFIYYYWQGVSGTFAYHKLKQTGTIAKAEQA
jgi:serine/threonine-protein kinase